MADNTVIIASRMPIAIQISDAEPQPAIPADPGAPTRPRQEGPPKPIKTADIAGERAAESMGGFGITRGVDKEVFDAWLKNHPEMKDEVKVVTEDEVKQANEDVAKDYGFEVGLKLAAEEAAKTQAPPARAPAHPAAQHATKA